MAWSPAPREASHRLALRGFAQPSKVRDRGRAPPRVSPRLDPAPGPRRPKGPKKGLGRVDPRAHRDHETREAAWEDSVGL